jgi:hypothetical protein
MYRRANAPVRCCSDAAAATIRAGATCEEAVSERNERRSLLSSESILRPRVLAFAPVYHHYAVPHSLILTRADVSACTPSFYVMTWVH